MARVAVLRGVAILDTSWLLELYRVPGFFEESRTSHVRDEPARLIDGQFELFATVPVLFEVASHITRVDRGHRRRALTKRLLKDIEGSINRDVPWTIVTVGSDILLRSEDVVRLAERFLESSGPNYSFADISVIDLTTDLRRRGREVRILAFDGQLLAYSD